ncbi:MAG: diacylglycerol kinase family protein [Bacteroidota bacterium]
MLKERLNSFKYAGKGIKTMFSSEPNARIHLVFTILVLIAGFFFQISLTEWAILVVCIGMVFGAEAFNTAIENLTDLASPELHPLAGKAKDTAAGAVLLCAIASAIAGSLIFIPKLLALLNG